MWWMNGLPYNLSYYRAVRGRYDGIWPIIENLNWKSGESLDVALQIPCDVVPALPPTMDYLAEEDISNQVARDVASFYDYENGPTPQNIGPPGSSHQFPQIHETYTREYQSEILFFH